MPILIIAAIAGIGTYLYEAKVVKPVYQTSAIFEVDVPPSNSIGGGSDPLSSEAYTPAAVRTVHSLPVATHALALIQGFLKSPLTHAQFGAAMGLTHPIPPAVAALFSTMQPAHILLSTSVTQVPNSQDVSITASSQIPIEAALMANAVNIAGSNYQVTLQTLSATRVVAQARQHIANLQAEIANLTAKHQQNSSYARSLRTQISTTRTDILQDQGNAALNATTFLPSIPASVPTSSVSPHPLREGGIAGIIALLFMVGAVLGREYFSTTLRSPEEVSEAVGGAPVLGAILQVAGNSKAVGPLLTAEPRSATSEGLRVIRTNLLFSNVDHPPRSILLTSARQGEGKTTVSSNLAVSLAELGGRVIIIDADLRKPTLGRVFGIDTRTGLTNALVASSNEPLDQFVRRLDAYYGLTVMPSGPIPPNPAELLSSGRMRELVHRLLTLYDTVVIDSPPLLAVADPAILSTMTESVVFVADANQLTLQTVTRAREALDHVGTSFTGVILNKVTQKRRGGYYYNYYYRHDYGYGYAEPANGKTKSPPTGLN